jgi:RNA-binding protein
MRKLGVVVHYSGVTKRLIVRAVDQTVPHGYGVDLNGYVVGKIDEVFGPVSKPYCALRPSKKIDPYKYVGEQLFLLPQTVVEHTRYRNNRAKNRRRFGRSVTKA